MAITHLFVLSFVPARLLYPVADRLFGRVDKPVAQRKVELESAQVKDVIQHKRVKPHPPGLFSRELERRKVGNELRVCPYHPLVPLPPIRDAIAVFWRCKQVGGWASRQVAR
jgi:hypothetical protein